RLQFLLHPNPERRYHLPSGYGNLFRPKCPEKPNHPALQYLSPSTPSSLDGRYPCRAEPPSSCPSPAGPTLAADTVPHFAHTLIVRFLDIYNQYLTNSLVPNCL